MFQQPDQLSKWLDETIRNLGDNNVKMNDNKNNQTNDYPIIRVIRNDNLQTTLQYGKKNKIRLDVNKKCIEPINNNNHNYCHCPLQPRNMNNIWNKNEEIKYK